MVGRAIHRFPVVDAIHRFGRLFVGRVRRAPPLMSAVTYATAQILRMLPRERIGRAVGRLADRRWSRPVGRAVTGLYSRVYDVALDECADERGWTSFDAFFTRRLRDGVRPVDRDPHAVL